jgi:hypothetical protein
MKMPAAMTRTARVRLRRLPEPKIDNALVKMRLAALANSRKVMFLLNLMQTLLETAIRNFG